MGWVSAEELELLNDERMKRGDPFLLIPYKAYEEDRPHLHEIRRQARSDFRWLRSYFTGLLSDIDTPVDRQMALDQWTAARATEEQRAKQADGLSQWFADYLIHNGYWIDDSPILYKQMIMEAFPPLLPENESELTGENMEAAGINYIRVLNRYLDEPQVPAYTRAFAGSVVT